MPGTLPALGACVPPAIADAYCGAAARATASGCVPRACPAGEGIDVSTGACGSAAAGPLPSVCADGGAAVLSSGHAACVPAAATCPRGTVRAGSDAALCARLAACPPGSLPEPAGAGDAGAPACRAVVASGARDGLARVDVGAWAAIALGSDGGPGSDDLCSPLSLRPDVFALPEGAPATIAIRIVVLSPDEDLTRVQARVSSALVSEGAERPLSTEGAALVERSVATMIEPLRSLGGEASTAALQVDLRCQPRSL
jgi:hypothetical protein